MFLVDCFDAGDTLFRRVKKGPKSDLSFYGQAVSNQLLYSSTPLMHTMPSAPASNWLNKVPEVTLAFWVIKIMSTTVGETGADFLAVNAGLGQGMTRGVMGALLAIALFIQLSTRRYTPWIYWLTVVLISVVGTQITDLLTDGLGVSLYVSTSVFAVMLAMIFAVWYQREHTLSIHEISTPRRELFYWAAIL